VLISVGLVALDQREYTRAEHALTESLRLGWQANMVWLAATHLDGIAGVAGGRGQMDRAARLFGAADALRSRIGTPIRLANRFRYEKDVAAIRAALGEAWFTASWNEGRAMTVDQAIAYALDEAPGRLPTAAGSC
jgi:hypothetical protein